MALAAGQPARRIDPDELEALTRSHLPLVYRSVARVIGRIPRKPLDDDLVAAAMMGLVQAAVAFDPTRNVSFVGFAAVRVRGAVLDELRRADWASRPVRTRAKRMDAAVERLTASLGRAPTSPEVAEELGMTVAELRTLIDDVHRALVLSTSAPEATEALSRHEPDPLDRVIDLEAKRSLESAIRKLPPRLHCAVVGYYFEGRTMREIGEELGVTESRVSQMLGEAVDRLRPSVVGAGAAVVR